MKVKTKKILAISLPISFGVITLVTSSAAIVSCSSTLVEPNQPSEPNQPEASIKSIPVNKTNINNVANNINKQTNKITIAQFNNLFLGNQAQTNIDLVASALGINGTDISNIKANGTYNNATITITAKNDYIFTNISNELKTITTGEISDDGKNIVFKNVNFSIEPSITNFATNIQDNLFITVGNNEITKPSTSSSLNVELSTENNFTINVVSKENTNGYFNINLPSIPSKIFDISNLGINIDNLKLKWAIKTQSKIGFALNNDDNNQFIYNSQIIGKSNVQKLILTASILNTNNDKVTNDIDITFNIGVYNLIELIPDGQKEFWDYTMLDQVFEWIYEESAGGQPASTMMASADQASLSIEYPSLTPLEAENTEGRVFYNLGVNLGTLAECLKKGLVSHNVCSQEEINTIIEIHWNAPTPTEYDQNYYQYFTEWNGINDYKYSNPYYSQNGGIPSKGEFSWSATFKTNSPFVGFSNFNFGVIIWNSNN